MKIQSKLFIFLIIVFGVFSLGLWHYTDSIIKTLNEKWGERLIKEQITFDKYRTLLPIRKEVALVREMASNSDVLAMANDDLDANVRKKGLEALEKYRLKFKDRSYFAAFSNSKNYYFNDYENSRAGNQLSYQLSPTNEKDAWFFNALAFDKEYQVNVNEDTVLGTTKVWINYLLKDNEKTIGIIGTGLELGNFLKDTVDIDLESVRNIFVTHTLAIQLDKNPTNIDYSTYSKKENERKKLELIFNDAQDIQQIQKIVNELSQTQNEDKITTLWAKTDGSKKLVGISYLKDLDWFNISILDPKELAIFDTNPIVFILNFLLLVALLSLAFFSKIMVIDRIMNLKQNMKKVENGDFDITLEMEKNDEIGELSNQFKLMLDVVSNTQHYLEGKIDERTKTLKESEEKLQTILDNVEAYIYIKDKDYKYLYGNKYVRELFGVTLEELVGKEDSEFFDEKTAKKIREYDAKVIQNNKRIKEEEINKDKKTETTKVFISSKIPLYKDNGEIYGLCGISTDITERKQHEDQMKHIAFHDTLTQLPNRHLFDDRIKSAIVQSKRTKMYSAILFLDLDNFKPLNDNYGHDVGDLLLIEAAKRLQKTIREVDTVARFGGDEFVVLLNSLSTDKEESKKISFEISQKIQKEISEVYQLDIYRNNKLYKIEHKCTVSIGISLFLGHELSKDEIIVNADNAMYKSKELGRDIISFDN